MNEIIQNILGILVSVGGTGAIFWELSSYLGKIWAEKHLESIKKEYQKEIEEYRTRLNIYEKTVLLYSGQQFELYSKLWHSLYDLKLVADTLWEKADNKNLREFSKQLKNTIDEVEKSYLFIEPSHYEELSNLLDEFKNYEFGKKKLIQLRAGHRPQRVDDKEIQQLIENNRGKKQQYEQLIKEIRDNLKKQLRGDI
jgi:hypothetical protein